MILAASVSILSALAFAGAIGLGLQLPGINATRHQKVSEARAAVIGGLAFLLLIVAVILWLRYLLLGPIKETVEELMSGY